jgi:hypothetical protein
MYTEVARVLAAFMARPAVARGLNIRNEAESPSSAKALSRGAAAGAC